MAVIICCFVLATGYIAFVIAERQTALQKFARYNDSWAVSQTVAEYLRLQNKLAVFALNPGRIDRDELQLRLDIMLSRLELLKQGNLGAFINEKQQWRDLVTRLDAVLARLEQRVNTLDPAEVPDLLATMSALDAPMTTLASSSVAYDVNLIDTAHEDVRKLHIVYTALAGGLILCGIALVILLLRQNDLLNRAQKSMRGLTDDLRAATLELQAKNVRLEHDAYHDALTGLPNRALFRQELIERLRRSFGGTGTTAILLLDLDGFKDVNDTLGHSVGDELLVDIARRLTGRVREQDLVARLGGDEFALLVEGVDASTLHEYTTRILDSITAPFTLAHGHSVHVTTSIGVRTFTRPITPAEALRDADTALYRAKTAGKNQAAFFESTQ